MPRTAPPFWQILSHSPEDTTALARWLGARLGPGDVLLLSGSVGAGKTHFARSLIQSLLVTPEDVPSPTYTLVQSYDAKDFEIIHADLYRLSAPDEIEELGLSEAFTTALCLIEWPDRLGSHQPLNALHLAFESETGNDKRMITIHAADETWTTRLKGVADV